MEAVRTDLIQDTTLLRLADTLGLQLYQELPIDYFSADRLRDSLSYARGLLQQALRRARGHPSARHFGLARRSETSDTTACASLRQLTDLVHSQGPPGSQTYYLSAFVKQDQCAGAVDLVLLDGLRVHSPQRLLTRWRQRAPDSLSGGAAVGLGTLGMPVKEGAGTGLRRPYSPEAQARYFETSLRAMLADTSQVRSPVFFVYRWQDVGPEAAATAYGLERPGDYSYGLIDAEGNRRPAFEVVRGFFTGNQMVFAFKAGEQSLPPFPWLRLLGWGILFLLGMGYLVSEQFQELVPRYFGAHAFYREAVREGRNSLLGINTILLVALSLSIGIIGSMALQVVGEREVTVLLMQQQPEAWQDFVVTLLTRPIMLALLLGSFFAFVVGLWTLTLTLLSYSYESLDPMQVLLIVLLPHWWLVVLMVAVLVIDTLPAMTALFGLTILIGLLLLTILYATLRTIYDYGKVARTPFPIMLFAGLISPVVLLALVAFFSALGNLPDARFIWSLATREVMG